MRRFKYAAILAISSLTLMFIACGDDPTEPVTPDVTITVGSGTTPTISWTFNQALKDIADPTVGNVSSIEVSQETAENEYTVYWFVDDDTSGWDDLNGISSPVTYGVKPTGSVGDWTSQDPLVQGTEYIVNINIMTSGDGVEWFEHKFTP